MITRLLILTLTFFSMACFNLSPQTRNLTSSASLPDDELYDLQKMDFPDGNAVQTVQVLNFRGVGKTFESLTGTSATDLGGGEPNVTNDMPTYSLTGTADSITAPMLYNEVKLAAGLCLLTVRKERGMAPAVRKFFNSLDFTKASTGQDIPTAIKDATNRVSRTICGTDADSGTQSMVQTEIESSFNPTDTLVDGAYYSNVIDSAVMVCTSFLSSSCALVNN